MVRNDTVTGPIQDNFIHGGSPIHDGQYVLRLESGTDAAGAPLEDSGRFWDSHSAIYYNETTGQANIVGVATATQVEVYAPGGTVGNRYGGVTWRNGIELPDYEANLIDVDDWENQPPQIREQP
jgi:hypothetical protein